MARKTRIAIIGAGFIGEVHIQAFQKVSEAELVAISDVNAARLEEMRSRYGIPKVYADNRLMLRSERVDGVVIATPDHLHLEPVQAVAAAGLPMLLEKPIATTPEDARGIIDAVEKAGAKATMGFACRFYKPYVLLKERAEQDAFGVLHTAYASRICSISEARRFKGRCSVNQYIACHDLDYLLWVLGPDVESVFARRSDSRAYQETGQADSYWTMVRWKNGATASLLISWGMPLAAPQVEDALILMGTKGGADKDRTNHVRVFSDEGVEEYPADPNVDLFQEQARGFLDLIWGRAEPRSTLMDGLRAQKLIWAAEESAQSGLPVSVQL